MKRAMTLIEVLAVMTLLTLVAGMGISALARTSDGVQFTAIGAELREMDARGRLLAMSAEGGRAIIDFAPDGTSVQLRLAHELIANLALPDGFTVQMFTEGGSAPASRILHIDARGRSRDYFVEISRGAASQRWLVHGVSGLWTRVQGRAS